MYCTVELQLRLRVRLLLQAQQAEREKNERDREHKALDELEEQKGSFEERLVQAESDLEQRSNELQRVCPPHVCLHLHLHCTCDATRIVLAASERHLLVLVICTCTRYNLQRLLYAVRVHVLIVFLLYSY